jgi:hypothetical protein
MSAKFRNSPLILGMTGLLFAGCAGSIAPSGWLSTPERQQQSAYGAWARVNYQQNGISTVIDGELIAVDGDVMYILSPRIRTKTAARQYILFITNDFPRYRADSVQILARDSLVAVPVLSITRGRIVTYDAKGSVLGLWTLFGSLSTGSHGVLLLFSLPTWILVGSIATSAQGFSAVQQYPAVAAEKLKEFARFPQGLPDGLDGSALRPKKRIERIHRRR